MNTAEEETLKVYMFTGLCSPLRNTIDKYSVTLFGSKIRRRPMLSVGKILSKHTCCKDIVK